MIEAACAKQLGNVRFVVGDAEALPFEPQSFDAVLCSNSFHHYPHPERFFAEGAGFLLLKLEAQKGFRAHLVARKPS